MDLWQSIGLTVVLYMIGAAVIASSALSEPSQAVYLVVLGIGGLSLMLGGVKSDLHGKL